MRVGILKEIKTAERRVAMTPAGAAVLVQHGHKVLVENSAGFGSGFTNDEYARAGAKIASGPAEIFGWADMVMHVKEPQPQEYPLIREGQVVFTYLHLAADRGLTEALLQTRCVGIAYETVQLPDRSLPLLIPMSEVAGRLAAQEAAKYLEAPQGGRGVLLGGVTGVAPANVLVLGGGIVGANAAEIAAGMGANVTVLDTNPDRLRQLHCLLPRNCTLLMSSAAEVAHQLPLADAVIGAVLIPGAKAPRLVTRAMLQEMKRGALLVDVSIDQGGCFETSRPTTHLDPTYVVDGIVHYCVANMPGAVPRTSTMALTNATLPYALKLADMGWRDAVKAHPDLWPGVNVAGGHLTCAPVADAFELQFTNLSALL